MHSDCKAHFCVTSSATTEQTDIGWRARKYACIILDMVGPWQHRIHAVVQIIILTKRFQFIFKMYIIRIYQLHVFLVNWQRLWPWALLVGIFNLGNHHVWGDGQYVGSMQVKRALLVGWLNVWLVVRITTTAREFFIIIGERSTSRRVFGGWRFQSGCSERSHESNLYSSVTNDMADEDERKLLIVFLYF